MLSDGTVSMPHDVQGPDTASGSPKGRLLSRIKSYQLSPEERAVFDRAKKRASTYSTMAALGSAISAVYWARRRQMRPLASFFMISVSVFVGSQVGTMVGMARAAKEIKELPNSELRNIFAEFKRDAEQSRHQRHSSHHSNSGDVPETVERRAHSGYSRQRSSEQHGSDSWKRSDEEAAHDGMGASEGPAQSSSAWDALRQRTERTSAWDAIRQRTSSGGASMGSSGAGDSWAAAARGAPAAEIMTEGFSRSMDRPTTQALSEGFHDRQGEDWDRVRHTEHTAFGASDERLSDGWRQPSVQRINSYGDRMD